MLIAAGAHSDDYKVNVKFDATPWFEQSTDNELSALIECDFGGDAPADKVVKYVANAGDENVKDLFVYLDIVNRHDKSLGNMGFESQVDEDSAVSWIKANRPELLEVTCSLSMF